MNIYLIWQDVNYGYDVFDSAVVIAESIDDAKSIHPGGGATATSYDDLAAYEDWCIQSEVQVKEIGVIFEGQKRGVVCASFNAG